MYYLRHTHKYIFQIIKKHWSNEKDDLHYKISLCDNFTIMQKLTCLPKYRNITSEGLNSQ